MLDPARTALFIKRNWFHRIPCFSILFIRFNLENQVGQVDLSREIRQICVVGINSPEPVVEQISFCVLHITTSFCGQFDPNLDGGVNN